MQLILISGKAGHGKDTLANRLSDHLKSLDYNVLIIHYGDLVKFFAANYYGWDGQKDVIGRQILQHLGTNTIRKVDPDYWVEVVARFLKGVENDWDFAIVPDARFVNEIDVMRQYFPDLETVRVERISKDGALYVNATLSEKQRQHPSETSLDDYGFFDYIIKNIDGDEESLDVAIEEMGY